MANTLVQISDLATSADPDATISTVGLGSCIAVILHDPARRIAGLLHYMLPLSKVDRAKAKERPAMFADTGVPLLFAQMESLGSKRAQIVVKVAGGAALYEDSGVFQVGKRNYNVLRKLLWKNGISIAAQDVGGNQSRSVQIEVGSGLVRVRTEGKESTL